MIPLQKIVESAVYLLVAGIIFGTLSWGLNKINPKEPFKRAIEIILVLGIVLTVICVLMSMIGHPLVTW